MRAFLAVSLAIAAIAVTTPAHAQGSAASPPHVTTGTSAALPSARVPQGPRSFGPTSYVPEGDLPRDGAVAIEQKPAEAVQPPPAAEVKEDPRTMITRDRIQSPQH